MRYRSAGPEWRAVSAASGVTARSPDAPAWRRLLADTGRHQNVHHSPKRLAVSHERSIRNLDSCRLSSRFDRLDEVGSRGAYRPAHSAMVGI